MEQGVGGENSPSQFINNDLSLVPSYENGPSQSINNGSSVALLTMVLPTMVLEAHQKMLMVRSIKEHEQQRTRIYPLSSP
jgi:hypothetical protein